ncbi:MAG: hydroxymethylpyrimidine/phosphomethylpyrimidine kinase [Rickettsiales bacterium]
MSAAPVTQSGRVLIIAGSDSGGGAGIQGDLKTVQALGGYGMTAITALTAQNTLGVFGIHPVPEAFIAQQISLCLEDIGADAIKTGMLHSAGVIEAVVESLGVRGSGFGVRENISTQSIASKTTAHETRNPNPDTLPLVVDPVMVAKGGAALLEAQALEALKKLLIPRAALITPNLPEAELLLGRVIAATPEAMTEAARALLELGCAAVLLKGGHGQGDLLYDVLVCHEAAPVTLTAPRIDTRHTHGTGCALASAIATGLAQKLTLEAAVRRAHAYVQGAIARAPGFGQGHGPLGH